MIEGTRIIFIGIFMLGAVAAFAFWIWMLVECVSKEPDTGNTKLIWILVILFAHVIGAMIYFFVRRPQRFAEVRQ
jgi:hypothetical protein